ncbi:DUF3450 domain-containing protein [Geovibrio thiophilus]|uniref:DUF3450 domain-containing protein n=1 Tax=Geovibrio thiophilus TaxID=139438 RepID=A0A3R5X3P0_9BACT|nr:DUF3450 domain-containing protein [Geovibrio thiophilus]QAR33785.1 DUF3450 domain-containing protein [Geovibrio thiophilus]
MNKILVALCVMLAGSAYAAEADKILDLQKNIHDKKSGFYSENEKWQEEKINLEQQYIHLKRAVAEKEAYLKSLKSSAAELKTEADRSRSRIAEGQKLKTGLETALSYLLEKLGSEISSGDEAAVQERSERIESLVAFVAAPDVLPAEKVRRVMEAYKVEADMSRYAEIRSMSVTVNGEQLNGYVLRAGGLAGFFTTPDGTTAAFFNPSSKQFEKLDSKYSEEVIIAGELVNRKRMPALVTLPVGRIEVQ